MLTIAQYAKACLVNRQTIDHRIKRGEIIPSISYIPKYGIPWPILMIDETKYPIVKGKLTPGRKTGKVLSKDPAPEPLVKWKQGDKLDNLTPIQEKTIGLVNGSIELVHSIKPIPLPETGEQLNRVETVAKGKDSVILMPEQFAKHEPITRPETGPKRVDLSKLVIKTKPKNNK